MVLCGGSLWDLDAIVAQEDQTVVSLATSHSGFLLSLFFFPPTRPSVLEVLDVGVLFPIYQGVHPCATPVGRL